MNERVYNFSAGPSMLPETVLRSCGENILNYEGSGMSVMEMSHRSAAYNGIIETAEQNLRTLMEIPEDYDVLFLQGGATLQFSMVPLNLLRNSKKADYIVTGSWASKAAKEAEKYGDIKVTASSKEANYTYIPKTTSGDFRSDADYVHITYNNTIYGTHFPKTPDFGGLTGVCDISSCILGEKINVKDYGLIYAGAQKNIAPAGLTIVIIKKELVGFAPENVPVYLDYKTHTENASMYNTPPAWCIYVAGEVFKDVIARGGVDAMQERNIRKAGKLYDYIDESRLYTAPANKEDRSLMNCVFVTGDEALDKKFVAQAKGEGLVELGGHRSVGGMRASIYNAMPEEGVDKLIDFMKRFEKENI